MDIFCKCYCYYLSGKAYTEFFIEEYDGKILKEGKQNYKVKNEYEGYIKIINYMVLNIEEIFKNLDEHFNIVILFSNVELIQDLISCKRRKNLSRGADGIFLKLCEFIKIKNVKLKNLKNYEKPHAPQCLKANYDLFYSSVEDIKGIIEEALKKDSIYYNRKISNLDLMTQDILHFIENKELNNEKKVEYIDCLKRIRQVRRCIKNDREIREQFNTYLHRLKNGLNYSMRNIKDVSVEDIRNYKKIFNSKEKRDKLLDDI